MRRLSVIAALGLALLLAMAPAVARKKSAEDLPVNERGFIAGRITFDCYFSPLRRYKGKCVPTVRDGSIVFKSDAGEKGGLRQDSFDRKGREPDVVDDQAKERGYDFCVAMKVARYTISQLNYFNVFPGGAGFSLPGGFQERFAVPFEVRPNEVVYLGDLKFSTEKTKSLLGVILFRPDAFVLRKGSDQEFERALAKCPVGASDSTKRSAPLSDEAVEPHPLLRQQR